MDPRDAITKDVTIDGLEKRVRGIVRRAGKYIFPTTAGVAVGVGLGQKGKKKAVERGIGAGMHEGVKLGARLQRQASAGKFNVKRKKVTKFEMIDSLTQSNGMLHKSTEVYAEVPKKKTTGVRASGDKYETYEGCSKHGKKKGKKDDS